MPDDIAGFIHRRTWSPAIRAAAVFTALYVIAAALAALLRGNTEFAFYIVVMLVMIAGVGLVHMRLQLTATLLWLLSIWGLLHMAGGLVPVPDSWPIAGDVRVLYSWWVIPDGDAPGRLGGWLKYDHVVHAYGYGVTTLLLWQVTRALVYEKSRHALQPSIGIMVITVAAASGFGAFNEIVEFTATLFAETNVGGYVNTGLDLVANTTGAIIGAIIIMSSNKQRRV